MQADGEFWSQGPPSEASHILSGWAYLYFPSSLGHWWEHLWGSGWVQSTAAGLSISHSCAPQQETPGDDGQGCHGAESASGCPDL